MTAGASRERRKLHIESLQDIIQEAERITAPGGQQLAQWTAAQNVQHVPLSLRLAVDGYGAFAPPPHMKILGRLLKGVFLRMKFKPGTKAPGNLGELVQPAADVTPEEAMQALRDVTADIATRGWISSNPVLGNMRADQWIQFHCRHAELHFGHIIPAE